MSKVRTSASKKINLMALIQTLTISTTTFERMKEKFYGFRQTEIKKIDAVSRQRIGLLSFRYRFEALVECDFILDILLSKSLLASNPKD